MEGIDYKNSYVGCPYCRELMDVQDTGYRQCKKCNGTVFMKTIKSDSVLVYIYQELQIVRKREK